MIPYSACRKRALAHGIALEKLAMGSGLDPPCHCRGTNTDARDRIGKLSLYSTAVAAPGPLCSAPGELAVGFPATACGDRGLRVPPNSVLALCLGLSPSALSAKTLNYDRRVEALKTAWITRWQ